MEEFIHVVTADNSKTLDCAIPLGACLVKYPNEALAIKITRALLNLYSWY